MGQACCSGAGTGGEPELGLLYPATSLNGKQYTARQVWIIVKIQSTFRMWLARRKVQMLYEQKYGGGRFHHHENGGEDYENMNVQVSILSSWFSFLLTSSLLIGVGDETATGLLRVRRLRVRA